MKNLWIENYKGDYFIHAKEPKWQRINDFWGSGTEFEICKDVAHELLSALPEPGELLEVHYKEGPTWIIE